MKDEPIIIVKQNGMREPFNPNKLSASLRKIGIQGKISDQITNYVSKRLYQDIPTKKIYSIVYSRIKKIQPEITYKFNLKNALFEMGPDGFYFEDYISRLLQVYGYNTLTRQKIQGKAVSHEIDVIASKGKKFMIECKFHNDPGIKCSIQTILYIHARFLDIKKIDKEFYRPWLITNTKISEDAVRYAESYKIKLLAWKHPFNNSLESMIDHSKCYPITVIPLKKDDRYKLLGAGIVSILDIPKSPELLMKKTGFSFEKSKAIVDAIAKL